MVNYEITIAKADEECFNQCIHEMYPALELTYWPLIFTNIYNLELSEEEYLFLKLKFKFIDRTTCIILSRVGSNMYP